LRSLRVAGAVDGLSIGFRTVKGRIDPRTRIRRLVAVDLWKISIVTFPLLAGARVCAVKHSPPRSQSGVALAERGATSPPRASCARTRAERAWARIADTPCVADAAPRLRTRAPLREHRMRDGTLACGRLRAWRA
jgi:hypothetical protein